MKLLKESLAERLINMKQFPNYNQPDTTLYHNTKLERVESILEKGILTSKARFPDYEGDGIWVTSKHPGKSYGGRTVAFNSIRYELQRVGDWDYRIYDDILPKDILFVDVFVTPNHRLSDVPDLIKKYGHDKVMNIIKSWADKGAADAPYNVIEELVKRA